MGESVSGRTMPRLPLLLVSLLGCLLLDQTEASVVDDVLRWVGLGGLAGDDKDVGSVQETQEVEEEQEGGEEETPPQQEAAPREEEEAENVPDSPVPPPSDEL